MAELKPNNSVAAVSPSLGFHGITAVAELKQIESAELKSSSLCFHGITAVAELKRGYLRSGLATARDVSTASQPWPN